MLVAILISCAIMGWIFTVACRGMYEEHGCSPQGDFLSEWIAATIMGAIAAVIFGIVFSFGFLSILAAGVYLLIYYFVEKRRIEKQGEEVQSVVDRLNNFADLHSKSAKYVSFYVQEEYIVADIYRDYEEMCSSEKFFILPIKQGVAMKRFMYEAKQRYSDVVQAGSSINFTIFFHR